MNHLVNPDVRRWLYGVTAAALTVAGIYGIIDGQQLAAWMGLAAAMFGLAIANTPASEPRRARLD